MSVPFSVSTLWQVKPVTISARLLPPVIRVYPWWAGRRKPQRRAGMIRQILVFWGNQSVRRSAPNHTQCASGSGPVLIAQ